MLILSFQNEGQWKLSLKQEMKVKWDSWVSQHTQLKLHWYWWIVLISTPSCSPQLCLLVCRQFWSAGYANSKGEKHGNPRPQGYGQQALEGRGGTKKMICNGNLGGNIRPGVYVFSVLIKETEQRHNGKPMSVAKELRRESSLKVTSFSREASYIRKPCGTERVKSLISRNRSTADPYAPGNSVIRFEINWPVIIKNYGLRG